MSKVISITDKLNNDKPKLEINGKEYEVNNSMGMVFKVEELANKGTKGMYEALKATLGEKACEEIQIDDMSVDSFKALTTGLLAAMQGTTYEEAAARFQK